MLFALLRRFRVGFRNWRFRRVNHLKQTHPVMSVEGKWEMITDLLSPTVMLSKRQDNVADPLVVIVNKDWHGIHQIDLGMIDGLFSKPARMIRVCHNDDAPLEPVPQRLQLSPAEIVYIVAEGSAT